MRTFIVGHASSENGGYLLSTIKVKACTLRGAFKRARKKIPHQNDIYQVTTRVRGCALFQPVWNYVGGNMSKYFGLNL